MAYKDWVNWYHGKKPKAPIDSDPAPDPDPDPQVPNNMGLLLQTGDEGPMDPIQQAIVDASIKRQKRRGVTISAIDFGTVQYASLDEALKAQGFGDRSGEFSSLNLRDKKFARAGEAVASLDMGISPIALVAGGAFGPSDQFYGPTGKDLRSIPRAGLSNKLASMAINAEFEALYKIKQHNMKNPEATGKAAGFGFTIGGINIWREPGTNKYSGQLGRAGLNQQTARSLETYIKGISKGTDIANAMLKNATSAEGADVADINLKDSETAILQTINGGYLLDGRFHFGSGVGSMGEMEDLEALAASLFSAGGRLSEQQSMRLAISWRDSARDLPKDASAADLLANLNAHIKAATSLQQSNLKQQYVAAASTDAAKASRAAAEAEMETYREEQRQRTFDQQMYGADSPEPERRAREDRERSRVERTVADIKDGGRRETFAQGFNEGGDIPEEDDSFFRGTPDGEEPMITGNELLASRGDESGFVERPPSEVSDEKSVADDKPMVAKEEGMVLNAEAVKIAGEQDVAKMIKDAEDYVRSSGKEAADDREATDIQISEGEVYISPQLADVIGRDRLRKINDRGIPKTEKKLQKAAKGGKVKGYQSGGDVGGDGAYDAIVAAQERFADRFPGDTDQERVENARIEAERIMKGLNAEDAMAITMIGEASILGDDGMEAVGHVINNRANSMYREYADQPTHVDVITRRLPGRDYQFNALEFRTLRRTLNEITSTEYGRRKYEEMRAIAAGIINGDREDITGGALLFWNPATSTNQHIRDGLNNGTYEVAYTQGQGNRAHQFIRPVGTELAQNTAASEFPTDIESGFMVPELPAEPVQPAPTQTVSSGVTLMPPTRQAPESSFMSMGDGYP